ncbi:Dyp-type peroxidase [Variovorax sp. YR216]|uniref:Dyp-type peroxidase n=1 Tax=Variovorax sp. YR216 TaxID=1882828 RepID=UPI00089CE47D|nr:Dyp-type peroxidase [Variovorax sp. YR216]SEA90194.1 Dyp-type peroxidase family [Variovorax sp. YR216]
MRTKVTGGELGGLTNLAVLAPVKTGFIEGLETMTYVDRLHRLLDALNEARQNLKEATLVDPQFPDALGRFGILRNFRYAVVPPDSPIAADGTPGRYRLSLNVTFDGGWEPYMRVIYRDIGFLLDALFCHCDGYPGSKTSNYDTYCRWVRANEQMAGLFFADSSVTSSDQSYLEHIERIQRETAEPAQADRLIAGYGVKPTVLQIREGQAEAVAHPEAAAFTSLRALKGLYRLSPLFTSTTERRILLRFTREVLKDFNEILPRLHDHPLFHVIADAAKEELAWFLGGEKDAGNAAPPDDSFTPTDAVQAGIVGDRGSATHGCLVLLRVQDPNKAVAWLQEAPISGHGAQDADGIRRNVAFTYAGLRALGFSAEQLDPLPREFMDGMESRAGLLGDVRANHPDFWPRPERCDENLKTDPNSRVDLSTVHVAFMMRLTDDKPESASAALHPQLAGAISRLTPASVGMQVVAVQPTRSWREGSNANGREHFGFLDGFSQPGLKKVEPPPLPRDTVPPGDLFLGRDNSLGDRPDPKSAPPALLQDGTFLVVRKLRQHLDHLHAALDSHLKDKGLGDEDAKAKRKQAILEKMMGRRQDGTPLVAPASGNDFDYDKDADGRQCPFHAHVRRANPRDGREPMPRIVRAGMSYGERLDANADPKANPGAAPNADRGIVFMAYCASISEQFEVIQRWIAGGNSSGVSSAQADPFLAVPKPGDRRTFRCLESGSPNDILRVDLGDKPFATLQWGLYLFVPSMDALRHLAALRRQPATSAATVLPPIWPPATALDHWRQRLEDPDPERSVSANTWMQVRQEGGYKDARPYGLLVGLQADVLRILQDKGEKYSVQGYGHRMAASLGHNHLGMDADTGHAVQGPVINKAIEAITEREAFDLTFAIVDKVLKGIMEFAVPNPDGSKRAPVDLVTLAEKVLAALCTKWIGLPEPSAVPGQPGNLMEVGGREPGNPQPPRCPGNFFSASHFIFNPHPRPETVETGKVQGKAVLDAVKQLLDRKKPLGKLARSIVDGLQKVEAIKPEERQKVIARSISGVLLGFPPTVYGNYLRTMETWTREKSLWEYQQRLADLKTTVSDPYERARRALRGGVMSTMRKRPVPEQLWRCPVVNGQVVGARDGEPGEDQRVVLGIASALTDAAAPDEMMFGGSRDPSSSVATEHACPGYGMGVGVMLGLIAGLFEAGTLRPTGSPVLLMLTQQRPSQAPAAG